jgi:hypothetical protein
MRCLAEAAAGNGADIVLHVVPECGGDVDEGVEGESRDPTSQQIVDARLRHPTGARRLGLCPAAVRYGRCDLPHEIGTRPKVCGLLGGAGKCVPDAGEPRRV